MQNNANNKQTVMNNDQEKAAKEKQKDFKGAIENNIHALKLPEFEQMMTDYEMLYHATLAGDSLCEPAAEGDIVPFTRDSDMICVNNEDMTINFITHSPIYNSYDLQCLAILEHQTGHHEESAKAFKLASEIETDLTLAFNAGYQYLLAVKTEEALGMFDKAIEYIDASDEDDKEICRMQMIFYKARTLTFAGRYEEALPLLEELEREYPGEFAYPNMRGWMLRRMNRLEEAEEAINKSMYLGPDDANPYLEMAMIRQAQGDDKSSNELLEKITQMPVSPHYAPVMAEALWRLGRYDECRQQLNDQLPLVLAEREQEQCSLACMDAAVAYAVMGDDAEAEAMLEKSLEYTPVGLICTQDLEECAVLKRLDLYKTLIAQYA